MFYLAVLPSVRPFVTSHVNDEHDILTTNEPANWHQWSTAQTDETINFGVMKSKVKVTVTRHRS